MGQSHAAQKSERPAGRRTRAGSSLPVAYARAIVEIAVERGARVEQVLEGTGLSVSALDETELRISTGVSARVVFNAFERTGDDGLGIEFGLRTRPTAHGYVGFAAMSSSTLREALDLGTRYAHLRQRSAMLRVSVEKDWVVLEAHENQELGPLRRLFLEGVMIGFYTMAGLVLGGARLDGELWFDWPEPDYFARFRERLPTVRFSMPSVAVRLPARHLDRPLVMADSSAVRNALEQCEREQALHDPGPDNLLTRVRGLLVPGTDGYPELGITAARLSMSTRTLKRKLQERGTSYRVLIDDARYRQALRLLDNPALDIQQVAFSLGYADPACFTRAFRRWSGYTPSQVRAERRAAAGRA